MKFIHLFGCNTYYVASKKMWRIMKLIIVIMTAFMVQVSASTLAQNITLKADNISLREAFREIKKQTGYLVVYKTNVINGKPKVDLNLSNVPLEKAMGEILKDQDLEFSIRYNSVMIKEKEKPSFLDRVVDALTPPIDVRGVVLDEKGQPLPGATLHVKGTKLSYVADKEGKFFIAGLDDKAVLVVSYVGYVEKEVAVSERVSVQLDVKSAELQEVNVAYGKQEQRAVTGSVTVIKGDQIRDLPNRSFDKSLQGLVPGLAVTSGSGQPGGATSNFMLRGIATGASVSEGSASRSPLVVIDGIPVFQEPAIRGGADGGSSPSNPLAHFNPSDIESITILKDASAVSLYGSRASNGVILVTTKKGKSGQVQFNFRSNVSIASRLEARTRMLNQKEYLELLFESYRNSQPGITDEEIMADLTQVPSPDAPKFLTFKDANGKAEFYQQADWVGAYYNRNAITSTNELSASGGNNASTYYLNFEYTNQNGVVKNTGFDRASTRFNYSNRLFNWAKIGTNTNFSYILQNYPTESSGQRVEFVSPLNPIYNEKGEYIYSFPWGGQFSNNPEANVIAASELNLNRSKSYRGLSSLFVDINFLKDFTLSSTFGVDFLFNHDVKKSDPLLPYNGGFDLNGYITSFDMLNLNLINTNLLKYSKKIAANHNLNILVGEESQLQKNDVASITRTNLTFAPRTETANVGLIADAQEGGSKVALLSYFTQINYSFLNRYFLSGSFRTDGSSRFGKNQRFGSYWSVGTSYQISDENWFRPLKKIVNYFKLRGSFGPAGNSTAILDLYRYDRLSLQNYLGETAYVPVNTTFPGNPGIQWENTFVYNAGLDLRLLKERLTLAVDMYSRKTTGLVSGGVRLPLATGFPSYNDNIGDLTNKGIELAMSVDILKFKKVIWNLSGNWSTNKSKLTNSSQPPVRPGFSGIVNEVGQPYNSFYMPKWAGPNPANGRPTWIGLDGSPTEDYNNADYFFVGKVQPDGFGSVSSNLFLGDFQVGTSVYYSYGSNILFENDNLQNDGSSPYANQSVFALDRWQKPGDIAANPRRLLNGMVGDVSDSGLSRSTRYLFDGDFIRLSNVSIGYNVPDRYTRKIGINSLQVSLLGTNLATWTRYSNSDPENINASGGGNFLYPQQRTFSMSLNAKF